MCNYYELVGKCFIFYLDASFSFFFHVGFDKKTENFIYIEVKKNKNIFYSLEVSDVKLENRGD